MKSAAGPHGEMGLAAWGARRRIAGPGAHGCGRLCPQPPLQLLAKNSRISATTLSIARLSIQ